MRLLLVGNANHQFITNLTNWLRKADSDIQIDILTTVPVKNNAAVCYDKIFHLDFNKLFYKLINKIKGLRRYYRFLLYRELIAKLPDYEIVHIHFLSVDAAFIAKEIKSSLDSQLVISVWGSDFYRLKNKNMKSFKKAFKTADKITFTNEKTRESFIEKLEWDISNCHICRFGLAPLEFLKKMNKGSKECKKELGWDNQKLAITIGYNAHPTQQHIKIIEQLNSEAVAKLKNKVQLILPLTYGGDGKYIEKVQGAVEGSTFEYKMYTNYLTDKEVAKIRKASDIMIQVQKTDQFSGSMQEHLYTGDIVITGSWLPYQTLKDYGVYFSEVDKLSELPGKLSSIIEYYDSYKKETVSNPEVINYLSSWEKNIKDWIALYK
jgi:hypothetical protein